MTAFFILPPPPRTQRSSRLPDWGHTTGALHCKLIYLCFNMPLVIDYSFLDGCRGFLGRLESAISDPVHCWLPWLQNAEFSTNWQPGVSKCYWVNWQRAKSHRPKQKQTFRHGTHISKQNNCLLLCYSGKNFACFLNICKHMVFLCFSTVKKWHTAPLNNKKMKTTTTTMHGCNFFFIFI